MKKVNYFSKLIWLDSDLGIAIEKGDFEKVKSIKAEALKTFKDAEKRNLFDEEDLAKLRRLACDVFFYKC